MIGNDLNEASHAEGFFLDLLSEGPDIQALIDRATEYLGNPVIVADARFRILYASQNVDLDIPLWKVSLSEHYITEGMISLMEKNKILDRIRKEKGKAIPDDLPNDYHALRTPLFYAGKCCGFLGTYDYQRPFRDGDSETLLALAKAVSVLFHADPNILGALDDSRDGYFLELIKCETREMAEILTRRNSSIQFGRDKLLVCFTRRVQGMSAENVAFGRLRDFLRQGLYQHVSAIYKHHLVLLFSLHKTSDVTLEYIRSSIEECCEKYDLYAGFSYTFEEDSFIPLAYKQALKASLYAEPEKAGSRLCQYETYMLGDIMNASLRIYPAVMYEHPVLAKLSAYDREYGTRYVDTLRLYLEQFCNMKVTAAELGVHYNTIKYRLSMIEEICGQEIRNDPELLLRLSLSIRIQDFAEKYKELREAGKSHS